MKLKNKLALWTVPLICAGVGSIRAAPPGLAIIPKPAHIELHDVSFQFSPRTKILVQNGSADARPPAQLLSSLLKRATGFELLLEESATTGPVQGAVLLTTLNASAKLGAEGYDLRDGATIKAQCVAK